MGSRSRYLMASFIGLGFSVRIPSYHNRDGNLNRPSPTPGIEPPWDLSGGLGKPRIKARNVLFSEMAPFAERLLVLVRLSPRKLAKGWLRET